MIQPVYAEAYFGHKLRKGSVYYYPEHEPFLKGWLRSESTPEEDRIALEAALSTLQAIPNYPVGTIGRYWRGVFREVFELDKRLQPVPLIFPVIRVSEPRKIAEMLERLDEDGFGGKVAVTAHLPPSISEGAH